MYYIILMIVALYLQSSDGKGFDLKIPGPKRYDSKIAIVGAGPSGVHMAHLLKEKGFTKVTVLEKTSRIGGKAFTIEYRGGYHDMGALLLTDTYRHNIMKLVKKYIPGQDIDIPPPGIWTLGNHFTLSQYIVGQVMRRHKFKNIAHVRQELMTAFKKYMRLHQMICGNYEFALFPKPNEMGMKLMHGTMEEFLKRNNMMVLAPIFEIAHTLMGYGHMNDTSTLYFLTWMTREFMTVFMGQTSSNNAAKTSFALKKGVQRLWDAMVKQDRLDVQFNIAIRKVRRVLGPEPVIWIEKKKESGDWHWEKYDFLIWSPEMKTSLRLFDKVYPMEALLKKTDITYWTSSITDSVKVPRSFSPKNYYMDNMWSREENSVWVQIDSYGMRNNQHGVDYMNGIFPTGNDTCKKRTMVTYQVGIKKGNVDMYKKKLHEYFDQTGGKLISARNMTIWRYFPHFSASDIDNGILWKILDMQGMYGMWYIGSSVSFESLRDVTEYNRLITKYMILPA